MRKLILVALIAIFSKPVLAEQLEGAYLYRVSTVRAQPGKFEDVKARASSLYNGQPFARPNG